MHNIALFGDVLIDLIKDRKSFDFSPVCGGSIFNTAVTLARLSINVDFYSYIGNDFWGNFIIEKMREYKINSENVKRIDDYKTALAFCIINRDGNATYDFYRQNSKVKMDIKNIVNSSLFYYGSIFSILNENRNNVKKMINIAKKNNILIMYDPNIRKKHLNSKKSKKYIYENFKSSDIIKCSIEDLANITNITKIEDGFNFLSQFKPILAIITDGSNGSYAKLRGGNIIKAEAIKIRNIVDTIGAGDNFSAGIIYFLIKKSFLNKEKILTMNENILLNLLYFANKCAGFSLKSKGAFILERDILKLKRIFNSL
ncbi:MAG TPA: PfkB family carbohydrate kinase [Spirochaetota bacterium]|mgnify:FL=1|nr:PfkB family carbohydrate kinase [Spirochaetota bacterium]